MIENKDEITDLLERLQKLGANVHVQNENGAALSVEILNDLKGVTPQDFNAWVSWTKTF